MVTGFGKTNPIGTSGDLAPAGAQLTEPVTITIGGLAAPAVVAQPWPGGIGTDQVIFRVPLAVTAGNLPVVVTVGGQAAKSVLLPVALAPVIDAIVNGATFNPGAGAAKFVREPVRAEFWKTRHQIQHFPGHLV